MAAPGETLKTPRLTLRLPRPEDAAVVADRIGNYDVTRWLAVVPYPYAVADAEYFIDKSQAKPGRVWFIDHPEHGVIGGISTDKELGYWIARPFWGQGFALEATWGVVENWFSDPENGDLTSGYFDGNDRSARVLEKLGFERTGPKRITSAALHQDIDSQNMRLTRARWDAISRIEVTTDRLVLRGIETSDAEAIAALAGTQDVAPMIFAAKIPWPVDEVRRFCWAWQWRGVPQFRMAICLPDGTVIGSCGISRAQEVFYFFGRSAWGKGYATEAMEGFIGLLFDRFGLDYLKADVFHDNPASRNVLGKLGFVQTGEAMGTSAARLEPETVSVYRLTPEMFRGRS